MIYFVTGATGFLGGVLVSHLRSAGHDVRALVRDPTRADHLAAAGVTLHAGDVTDPASMRAPMRGVDGVFHVAGWYKVGVSDRAAATATNVHGTSNVLTVARDLGVPRVVYTSTLAVNSDTRGQVVDESYRFNGRHLSLYDETKHEAHLIAERFAAEGAPVVIVQPGLIYGPGDTSGVRTLFVRYLTRRLPAIPGGAAYSWAHVDDEARGHVLAMEQGSAGRNYFLAGPVHSLSEVMGMAQRITGIPVPRRLPAFALKGASHLMRLAAPFVRLPPDYSPEGLRVLAGVTYLGTSARARKELGWRARPLEDGLRETLRHEMRLLGVTAPF